MHTFAGMAEKNLREAMTQALDLVRGEIRLQMEAGGRNATGKASRELDIEIDQQPDKITGRIMGVGYWDSIEKGQPAPAPSSTIDSIKAWIRAKGIQVRGTEEGAAAAIVRAHRREGSPTRNSPARNNLNILQKSITAKQDAIAQQATEGARVAILQQLQPLNDAN